MASYNGERFIKEQIESIIAQTYQNWRLIIQDDGSMDCTVSMIEQFVKTDPRICMFVNDSGKHGPYQNFNALVNKCRNSVEKHDLYFFADQDDCWDRDKIEKFTAFYDLHAVEPDKPVLIYGDMINTLPDGRGSEGNCCFSMISACLIEDMGRVLPRNMFSP